MVNGFKNFKNLSASYLDNGRVYGKLDSILKFLIKPYQCLHCIIRTKLPGNITTLGVFWAPLRI
jgi:hypothetical protein